MDTRDLSRAQWRKSSYSGSNGDCVEVAVAWRTASYSSSNGACVEVAAGSGTQVLVRDTKDREGPVLAVSPVAWRRFAGRLKAGTPPARP